MFMKTANLTIETVACRKSSASFRDVMSHLRAKITDKVCLSVGCGSAALFVVSLAAMNVPVVMATGLVALTSVALAPVSE